MGFVPGAVAELDDAIGGEEVEQHENDSRDPKSDVDREVDGPPVRCERRKIPRTCEMKNHGTNRQEDDCSGQDKNHTPFTFMIYAGFKCPTKFQTRVYSIRQSICRTSRQTVQGKRRNTYSPQIARGKAQVSPTPSVAGCMVAEQAPNPRVQPGELGLELRSGPGFES